MKNKKMRIGIVGAGPAGLTAAEALADLGYENVTLIESRDRAGGQSLSQTYITQFNEKIVYELGSVMPFGAGEAQRLIKKFGLHYGRTITLNGPAYFKLYNLDTHQVELDFTKYRLGKKFTFIMYFQLIHDLWKLGKSLWRYRCLSGPGYHQLSKQHAKELNMSDHEWIDAHNFLVIGEDLKTAMGSMLSFANANYEDIPAAKFLKLLYQLIKHPVRYINGSYMPIREGYEELWNRVASVHDVKLSANIKEIKRDNNKIKMNIDDIEYEFDRLIITCAPREILNLMDATEEERSVFSEIKYCPGWRGAFTAKNMPFEAAYNIPHSYIHKNQSGISLFIPEGQVDQDTWLYTCTLSENQTAELSVLTTLAEKLLTEEFNAKDIKWVATAHWAEYGSYFPPECIAKGVYQRIDKMQGENNTYYLGEVIGGGSHCVVSTYAAYLIKRMFGNQGD